MTKDIQKLAEKEVKAILKVRRKIMILDIAKSLGNASKTCREFNVSKRSFFLWKKRYKLEGRDGLKRKKPRSYNHPNKISEEAVAKILALRNEYHLGPERIMWYLERYHGISDQMISPAECSMIYFCLLNHLF